MVYIIAFVDVLSLALVYLNVGEPGDVVPAVLVHC